jgi:O-antigen ligase
VVEAPRSATETRDGSFAGWRNQESRSAAAPELEEHPTFPVRAIWWIAVVSVTAVPLVIFPGVDSFRTVKESIFVSAGMLVAAFTAFQAIWSGTWKRNALLRDPYVALPAAAVAWTFVSMLFSSHRELSAASLVWVLSGAILFAATAVAARTRTLHAALWPAAAAVVNIAVLGLQTARIWNPIHFPSWVAGWMTRVEKTALIGNPNDVAAYFVPLTVAAAAFVFSTKGWRRSGGVAICVLSSAAIIATETLTAIAAVGFAVGLMLLLRFGRNGVVGLLLAASTLGVASAAYAPLRSRIVLKSEALRKLDFDRVLSYRLTPALAALHIWKDHPVFGSGPGTFPYHFFDAKIAVDDRYAGTVTSSTVMFGEAHNDYLEVLGETGVPGFLIMLAGLLLLARHSGGKVAESNPRASFARLLALPLAASFAVLALTGFPLALAAPLIIYLFYAALCVAWRSS